MGADDKDIKLIRELSQDGRRSLKSLATELGVSTVTVMNRMKRLRESGVLKGFTAVVDPSKLGYNITAIISIVTKRKELVSIEKKLAQHPNVLAIYDVTGTYDFIVVSRFRKITDLNRFLKKSLAIEGIENTYTQVALNVMKETIGIPLK
jgi:DNA-binding Lrp family transcriptional regulator